MNYVNSESVGSSLVLGSSPPSNSGGMKRVGMGSGLVSGLNSVDTMQKSVMNAFSLKYSELISSI